MAEELKGIDRAALLAVVAAAAEEFEGDILLLVRDRGKVILFATEGGGLDARVILSQCLRRLNDLEEGPFDPVMLAFVRVASEDLNNDQVMLIVREQGNVRLACTAGARGKERDILNDAVQAAGGERRRR